MFDKEDFRVYQEYLENGVRCSRLVFRQFVRQQDRPRRVPCVDTRRNHLIVIRRPALHRISMHVGVSMGSEASELRPS